MPKWTVCAKCKAELKPHERSEPYCDRCLRLNQTQPTLSANPGKVP